jgi:hypothetical protein
MKNNKEVKVWGEQIKKEERHPIALLIFIVIFLTGFCLLCQVLRWGFKQEEIKHQQRFEIYDELEIRLKQINKDRQEYKIAMFRESKIMRDLDAVAFCESGYNDNAKNPHSSALGRYQIIDSTIALCEKHLGRELNRTVRKDSEACAIWLYERYGLTPWEASKHCWIHLTN